MKFVKTKKILIVSIATIGIIVIVFIVNMSSDQLPITEKKIRTQLEQMYDADVAEVKKHEDVYEAIMAKNGQVYLVEVHASTGKVNSLEHTDDFIIQEVTVLPTEGMELIDEGHEVSSKKTTESKIEIVESHIVSSNGTTKLVIIEKPKNSPSNIKIVENPNIEDNKQVKPTANNETKAEEKPRKEVFKDAIKEVLASESTKPIENSKDDTKKDSKTESTNKTETIKAEASSTGKAESEKTDTATNSLRPEVAKPEISVSETTVKTETSKTENSEVTVLKTEDKKTEVVEKPVTVLITADEALKIANQQAKGVVESNSFVKTDEGGYYLIVITASKTEETKDTNGKEKKTKTKTTIQVHAISGKVLSVTLE